MTKNIKGVKAFFKRGNELWDGTLQYTQGCVHEIRRKEGQPEYFMTYVKDVNEEYKFFKFDKDIVFHNVLDMANIAEGDETSYSRKLVILEEVSKDKIIDVPLGTDMSIMYDNIDTSTYVKYPWMDLGYNDDNLLTNIIDIKTNMMVMSLLYDAHKRVCTTIKDCEELAYRYDKHGNLKEIYNASYCQVLYKMRYDDKNNLVSVSNGKIKLFNISWDYDNNRIIGINRGNIVTKYSYDNDGKITCIEEKGNSHQFLYNKDRMISCMSITHNYMVYPYQQQPGKKIYIKRFDNRHKGFLDMAKIQACDGTCRRRNYGAVIVKDGRCISTGFTKSPNGCQLCIDHEQCTRDRLNIPSGEQYEKCKSVHAEQCAIINAKEDLKGSILYLAGYETSTGRWMRNPQPCILCKRFIIEAGIEKVITVNGEYDVKEYINDIDNL